MDPIHLEDLAEIDREETIPSHRRWLGHLVVPVKRRLGAFLRASIGPLIEAQKEFNRATASEIRSLADESRAGGRLPTLLPTAIEGGVRTLEKKIDAIHDTLLDEIGSLEATLRRELESRIEEEANRGRAILETTLAGRSLKGFGPGRAAAAARVVEEIDYQRFQARSRGSAEEVREKLQLYLGLLEGHAPVLDAGCGRGELLAALGAKGVAAHGVDESAQAVKICREAGLQAETGDLVEHVAGLPDASLGAIFSSQVVEHLGPAGVRRFVLLASRKLEAGGLLVIETVNPLSFYSLTRNYLADWTHRAPVPPGTLRFFFEGAGLGEIRALFLSEVPDHLKLVAVPYDDHLDSRVRDALAAVNVAIERLNTILFAPQDYAVIGVAPGRPAGREGGGPPEEVPAP